MPHGAPRFNAEGVLRNAVGMIGIAIGMDLAPKIACALAVIAIGGATGGAVVGAQIGQSPILQRDGIGGERPSYDFQAEYDEGIRSGSAFDDPPDQYAIQTPEGRFEVGELRDRGLYRNRRRSAYDAALAAEDRAWEAEMAALDSGDWQPDARFADAEWTRAGGSGYEQERSHGVRVTRGSQVERETARLSDTPPPHAAPSPVALSDLPAPAEVRVSVALPAPADIPAQD